MFKLTNNKKNGPAHLSEKNTIIKCFFNFPVKHVNMLVMSKSVLLLGFYTAAVLL